MIDRFISLIILKSFMDAASLILCKLTKTTDLPSAIFWQIFVSLNALEEGRLLEFFYLLFCIFKLMRKTIG